MKPTWNTIKSKTGNKVRKGGVCLINIDGNLINNQQIVNSFNNYFLTIADKKILITI